MARRAILRRHLIRPAVTGDQGGHRLAGGSHTGHHAIGLRTAMLAKSADVVIVTSRLGGLWDMYGDRILREAGRVGQRVVLTSGWC